MSTIDSQFVRSANNVSFFFEEGAFDKDGKLVQDMSLCINKIGHGTVVWRADGPQKSIAAGWTPEKHLDFCDAVLISPCCCLSIL